jgi:hypothetical protein
VGWASFCSTVFHVSTGRFTEASIEASQPSHNWRLSRGSCSVEKHMMHLSPRTSPLGRIAVTATFLWACLGGPVCQAQRNSGAAAITLTAVLSQSLSMSISPLSLSPGSSSDLFDGNADDGNAALTISTTWVRGPASVSVGVFAPANPLLGAAGRALVPVASLDATVSSAPTGSSFLSSSNQPVNPGLPGIRINTGDLQIPPGSEAGMLTIRGQVL